jgi:hypothetical protein
MSVSPTRDLDPGRTHGNYLRLGLATGRSAAPSKKRATARVNAWIPRHRADRAHTAAKTVASAAADTNAIADIYAGGPYWWTGLPSDPLGRRTEEIVEAVCRWRR